MLETLFGSKLRTKVIGWLFSHPDERYFVRQLTKIIDEDSTNVSRELARLEKAGILISTIEGKQKYFKANMDSPIYQELHSLVLKTAGIADVLRTALNPITDKVTVAFIFGSIASAGENKKSDIDLMIIGDTTFADITSLLTHARQQLSREINTVIYPVAEFRKKAQQNRHFISNILEGEKIYLKGNERELDRLVE
jgi:predicted nucleotidyltransferase